MKKLIIPFVVLCAATAFAITVYWFSQAPHVPSGLADNDIMLIERPSPHTNMYATMADMKTYIGASGNFDPLGTAQNATNGLNPIAFTGLTGAGLLGITSFAIATNFNVVDSMRVVDRGSAFYGVNRYRWTNTLAVMATNGPLTLWFWGNGWVRDSIVETSVTNLFGYKPMIGVGGFCTFRAPLTLRYFFADLTAVYDLNIGIADVGITQTFDPNYTNWLSYIIITNNSIFSPRFAISASIPNPLTANHNFPANVIRVYYLKNPAGNTFYVDVRTNDLNGDVVGWTNYPDANWSTVGTLSSYNASWAGAVFAWTNALGVAPTQTRVRCGAVSQFTPIVDMGMWNNTISNGSLVGMFAQEGGPNLDQYTNLTAKTGPIWADQNPTIVFHSNAVSDQVGQVKASLDAQLGIIHAGYTHADVLDLIPHEQDNSSYNGELYYNFTNGTAVFNGATATADAWGSMENAVNRGLMDSVVSHHLTSSGYLYFGEMLWAWLDLVQEYHKPY
jgi:hypothetical protein